MRRILPILASILIYPPVPASAAQMVGDAATGAQVLQVFEQWTTAYEKGDLEGTMSIFAPSVVFAFQGNKDQNYEDLRKGYIQDFATRQPGTAWVPRLEEVYVEGAVAIVRSVWRAQGQARICRNSGEGSQSQRRHPKQGFRQLAPCQVVQLSRKIEPSPAWPFPRESANASFLN